MMIEPQATHVVLVRVGDERQSAVFDRAQRELLPALLELLPALLELG